MVVARIAARLFALIALVAVALGIYLIVHNGLSHHAPTPQRSTLSPTISPLHHHRPPRFYVVRGGDTLSAISIRTHVAISRLTLLNPSLSPNSLQTGQRLRLRR
ncbi:MAG: LysM peptidoglycan-binding domain-containing protein [Actinomycetota bacterium]|nr:LysM peptidoglycan-binding domain-containing protein [Actinomycetota bacterium]